MLGRFRDEIGLSEEDRKRALDDPGIPWKQWFLTTGLKPWVVLGLLLFEGLGLVSVWVALSGYARAAVFPILVAALYLDVLLWSFLWREPSVDEFRSGNFKNYWFQPFKIGRFTVEYRLWKEGKRDEVTLPNVNPRDFL
ncbi:MAG: hypothetical protein M1144_04680 [Candidatus Thermoplasmatota archaeon]|jgi:hypothetical protein|nr:hypothetical protein [Candidatus Thermoplasmatota archaeon]